MTDIAIPEALLKDPENNWLALAIWRAYAEFGEKGGIILTEHLQRRISARHSASAIRTERSHLIERGWLTRLDTQTNRPSLYRAERARIDRTPPPSPPVSSDDSRLTVLLNKVDMLLTRQSALGQTCHDLLERINALRNDQLLILDTLTNPQKGETR